jgi:hypothetical protein
MAARESQRDLLANQPTARQPRLLPSDEERMVNPNPQIDHPWRLPILLTQISTMQHSPMLSIHVITVHKWRQAWRL